MHPLELEVFLPSPDQNFEKNWQEELAKNGISIEFHPEFDIEEQSGFMPLKITFQTAQNEMYVKDQNLASGFELDIEKFDSLEYLTFLEDEGEEISLEYNTLISDCDFRLVFYADPESDTAAYRICYAAAAALVKLYNGVLIHTFSGSEFLKDTSIEAAIEQSARFEAKLTPEDWKLTPFENWK